MKPKNNRVINIELKDIGDKPIFRQFLRWKIRYIKNIKSFGPERDRVLKTGQPPIYPNHIKLHIECFTNKSFIHNESAYIKIGSLENTHAATVEMLVSAIPKIDKMRESGLISNDIKWVIALGSIVINEEKISMVMAYELTRKKLCPVSTMTPWSSPWKSHTVGYLVFDKK
jgi:hypothetical protein